MGTWDELCLLCGICPAGGPHSLLSPDSLDSLAREIASEIWTDADDKLLSIVTNALASSFSEDDKKLGYRKIWLPEGLSDYADCTTCIAIGYFDKEEGLPPFRDNGKVPDGRNVQVRRVREHSAGDFGVVVRTIPDEDGEPYDEEEPSPSACSVATAHYSACYNPNIFVCERCYHYLDVWLDRQSLPPRSLAFPSDPEPTHFPGEFYEVVNSRSQLRDVDTALLPCINYDGIQATLVQWQSEFAPGRRGSKHIALGIREGLRDTDLIPAIMRDFRCWMFMRPNIWPVPANSSVAPPPFNRYNIEPKPSPPTISVLPLDILLPMLADLPLTAFLSLSATCRSLRTLFTAPVYMERVLREALLRGSLRWILPVDTMPGETEAAHAAAGEWLSTELESKRADGDAVESTDPFASLDFPYLTFVRACYESDSMHNRKRIWGQVEQFRQVWQQYRMKGWEVDRFYPSSELCV